MIAYETEICWVWYFTGGRTVADVYRGVLGVSVPLASLPITASLLAGRLRSAAATDRRHLILGIAHMGIHLRHGHPPSP